MDNTNLIRPLQSRGSRIVGGLTGQIFCCVSSFLDSFFLGGSPPFVWREVGKNEKIKEESKVKEQNPILVSYRNGDTLDYLNRFHCMSNEVEAEVVLQKAFFSIIKKKRSERQ